MFDCRKAQWERSRCAQKKTPKKNPGAISKWNALRCVFLFSMKSTLNWLKPGLLSVVAAFSKLDGKCQPLNVFTWSPQTHHFAVGPSSLWIWLRFFGSMSIFRSILCIVKSVVSCEKRQLKFSSASSYPKTRKAQKPFYGPQFRPTAHVDFLMVTQSLLSSSIMTEEDDVLDIASSLCPGLWSGVLTQSGHQSARYLNKPIAQYSWLNVTFSTAKIPACVTDDSLLKSVGYNLNYSLFLTFCVETDFNVIYRK